MLKYLFNKLLHSLFSSKFGHHRNHHNHPYNYRPGRKYSSSDRYSSKYGRGHSYYKNRRGSSS